MQTHAAEKRTAVHQSPTRAARPHAAQPVAVRNILRQPRLQAKLKIGAANDPAEREADRVADQVMRMPMPMVGPVTGPGPDVGGLSSSGNPIQRMCAECEDELQRKPADEEEELQRKEAPGTTPALSASSEGAISGLSRGGVPLPASERAFFEPRFGQDFSGVRVHSGPTAHNAARSINARAFTLGTDIAFAQGEYAPGSSSGRRLLAHELTHTVQQSQNAAPHGVQRLVGFEFEMNFSGDTERPPGRTSATWASGNIRPKKDKFKIEMDGPRMEVTTDPFEENAAGRRELADTLDAVNSVGRQIESRCKRKQERGHRRPWIIPPADFDTNLVQSIYPRWKGDRACKVYGVPQATLGIKLAKLGDLIEEIRESRGKSRRRAFPLTGKFKASTRKSGRLGLTSEILFEAKDIVEQDLRVQAGGLSVGSAVKGSALSAGLSNYLTLVVSYLRTSVMLDERDYEGFAKAYPPIVAHSDLSKVFEDLLSADEQTAFKEIYGKAGVRADLYKLANERLPRSRSGAKGTSQVKGEKVEFKPGNGSTNLFPVRVGSTFTWDQFIEKIIKKEAVHRDVTPSASEYGPEEVGPPGSRGQGLVVELRRIGFTWWPRRRWKSLALHIYDLVRGLNR